MTSAESYAHDRYEDEVWRAYLTGDYSNVTVPVWERALQGIFKQLPSDPHCRDCNAPLKGIGSTLVSLVGIKPSSMNPLLCSTCDTYVREHQSAAEVDLSMLFADVRGSTKLAESMSAYEFRELINRFYQTTTDVLIHSYALIDRLIGDEVVAYYAPGIAGPDYARAAVEAAQELLRVTGSWIPIGVGVHTGTASIGAVGSTERVSGITALGDAVNTAARLASQAGPGELIVSEETCVAAGLDIDSLERRRLELKGKSEPIDVHVIHAVPN